MGEQGLVWIEFKETKDPEQPQFLFHQITAMGKYHRYPLSLEELAEAVIDQALLAKDLQR